MDSNAQANLWNQWYASFQNQMNNVASRDTPSGNNNGNNSSEGDEADQSSTSHDARPKAGPSDAIVRQNAAQTTELIPQQGQQPFQIPFMAPVPMPNVWGNPGFGFVPPVPYPFGFNAQNPVMMLSPNDNAKNSENDQMKNNEDADNNRTRSRERSRSRLRDRNDSDTSNKTRTIDRVGGSNDRNQPEDKSPQRSKTPDQRESHDGNIQRNFGQMMGFNPMQGFQYFMPPVFPSNCWNQGFGFVPPPYANLFNFTNGNSVVPGNSNVDSQRVTDESVKSGQSSKDSIPQSPTEGRKSGEDKYPLDQEEWVKKQQLQQFSAVQQQAENSSIQPGSSQSAVNMAQYTSFRTERTQTNLQQPAPQMMNLNMFQTYQFPAAQRHFNMLNQESAPIQINFTNATFNIKESLPMEKSNSDIQKTLPLENSDSNIQQSVLPKNANMVPLDKAQETALPKNDNGVSDNDVCEIKTRSTESVIEIYDDSDTDDTGGEDPSSGVIFLSFDNFKILPPLPKFRITQPIVIPSGCSTIRIEGLNDNLSKAEIHEIFVRYGGIVKITLMDNFYLLRYKEERSMEAAIGLTGHRLLVNGLKKVHTLDISYERTTRDGVPWIFHPIIERRRDVAPRNVSPVGNRKRPKSENLKISYPCKEGEGEPADLSEEAEENSRKMTKDEVDNVQFLLSSYPLRLFTKNKRLPSTKTTVKLLPPHPNTPPPFLSDKPPGCRTVCIEGIWQNFKWECVHLMFKSFGDIIAFNMNYDTGLSAFTVRYKEGKSADKAVSLSGYRLVADQRNWKGIIEKCIMIVDYISNPKDQNEWKVTQACLKEHTVEHEFKAQQIASNLIDNTNTTTHPKKNKSQLQTSPNKSTANASQNTLTSNQERPSTQVVQEATSITHNKPPEIVKSGSEENTKCVIRSASTESIVEIPDSDPDDKEECKIIDPGPVEKVEIVAYPEFKLLPPLRECPIPNPIPKPVDCDTIQIEGLNHNFTMNDLYLIFTKYGIITKIEILKNFCLVQYKDKEKTGAAITLSGYRLQNNDSEVTHTMIINFYDPVRNERSRVEKPMERKRAAPVAAWRRQETDPLWELSASGESSMRVALAEELSSSHAALERFRAANPALEVASWKVLYMGCVTRDARPSLRMTIKVPDADRRRISSEGLLFPPHGLLKDVHFPIKRSERKRRRISLKFAH